MTVIGITGPSGAGKGEVSRILNEKYGFPILDADKIYHSLVSSQSECLAEIRREFGEGVISQDGSLDRKALSELVFGDANKERLNTLNRMTHKHVVKKIDDLLFELNGKAKACIIDAPLLIEADLYQKCDFTVSVIASKELRAKRISARDGILIDAALKRINSQKNDGFYIDNTDYTLSNDGDIPILSKQIEEIIQKEVFS